MRYIPLYDVPLHIRVGVLIFQALGALVLGMVFFGLYRLITHEETFDKLYDLIMIFEEKKGEGSN